MSNDFDLIVWVAAAAAWRVRNGRPIRCEDADCRVREGGTCVNVGCVPKR
jgi:pyruvate/2-oxoglutarate dehydrogenase complex dihydrolipoamide dehydrogenase (E3) component